jgi:hypothetical protein
MGPIGFGFDQYHKMLTNRQIFWMTNFIGLPVAHLDDERRKGSRPEQFGKLFFHVAIPDFLKQVSIVSHTVANSKCFG